nr:MAG: RNA replicase beta chain [Sanya steitz-like virus 4]
MNRPTILLERLLLDAKVQFSLCVSADVQEIEHRFENEGMSFLTITLPTYCDAFDQALSLGRLSGGFPGFRAWKRRREYPAFLQGLLRRVFSYETGQILDTPCIESIRLIRQISRAFKKVLLPCSPERVAAAFERYKENDQSVYRYNQLPVAIGSFRTVAGYLWADLEVLSGELYCAPGRHGTGATAEHYDAIRRHDVKQWPTRGEDSYPLSWFTSYNEGNVEDFASVEELSYDAELPARVVQVPKTLKTPRIICVEPSYMMLRQQAVLKPLVRWLESGILGFKSVRFTDQSVNRHMAMVGSIDDSLATIDLSDASDLVGLDLVREIFRVCPTFLKYLEDARTYRSRLPDGSTINLVKYASMGSALCFPVEAMVFYTLVMSAIVDHIGCRPTRALLKDLTAKVSVYGDDIIVPSEYANAVVNQLEAFGLRVNRSKSFTSGYFKESCGGDYFRGHDITPVYVRQWDTTAHTRKPDLLASLTSLSNQLYAVGYWHACTHIRDILNDKVESKTFKIAYSSSAVGGVYHYSHWRDSNLFWCGSSHSYKRRLLLFQCHPNESVISTIAQGLSLASARNRWDGSDYWNHLPRGLSLESGHDFGVPDDITHRRESGALRNFDRPLKLRDQFSSLIDLARSGSNMQLHEYVRPHALKAKRGWSVAPRATIWR